MIELKNGVAQAVVNPEGAWIEELSSHNQPIFYPKTTLTTDSGEQKARGGLHVCLPNFGPSGDNNLSQHGFGRDSLWEVESHDRSNIDLRLRVQTPTYENMTTFLHYELGENSLVCSLKVKNEGNLSFRLAPGFHPYFYVEESETAVVVNDATYELDSLSGTEFLSSEQIALRTVEREFNLSQENLSTWAVWTDNLANYVCVEPTYGGYRFLEVASPDEHLAPGEEKTFSLRIQW